MDVVIGAGAVGSRLAVRLAALGHRVQLVSRSGSGPGVEGVETIACDAAAADRLAAAVAAPEVVYNCANPPYHRWPTDWPPIANSVADLAERHGAGLVILSNLYGYGPTSGPMSEQSPLASTGTKGRVRVRMWTDALARSDAGRLRVTEARAADYYGPGLGRTSALGRIAPKLLAGKPVKVLGSLDAPHSWTYIDDVAAALSVLGTDDRSWGRAWHVPTAAPVTQRQLAMRLCAIGGAPPPRLSVYRPWELGLAGLFAPDVRELRETTYQFTDPFVVDSTAFTATFGPTPTPIDTGLAAVAAALSTPRPR